MSSNDQLWGRVDLSNWGAIPVTTGRVAEERDVKEGRAVFYLQDPTEIGAAPIPLFLPRCARLRVESQQVPVIVIQAERAGKKTYIGYRDLHGGNGICAFEEVEFIDAPDARFFLES